MKKRDMLIRSALTVLTVYLFLVSIKLMGVSFKLFGTDLAEHLISLTSNAFVGLFIGILATSIIQSSSATTSIVVGLTASGALPIGNAIPIIMGANIGTGVTGILVSLCHIGKKKEFRKAFEVATVHDFFNFTVVCVMFPIEMLFHPIQKSAVWLTGMLLGSGPTFTFASPLNTIIKPVVHFLQWLLWDNAFAMLALAGVLLFFSLQNFSKIMKPLAQTEFKTLLNKHLFSSPARGFATGLLLTAFVQSSSVSISLIVPLAGVGILALERVFPYVLGANIGTTVTALMAALVTGSAAAVTVALAHTLFNTFGSAMLYPLRKIPLALARGTASISHRSRAFPFAFLGVVFFVLPVTVIYLFH
ncbi:Na/Pi symporter [Candidatus Woesearchaeota archaeon]|nr:Na/Pi symporter [Candidatus Woesearchaeota archaeon]